MLRTSASDAEGDEDCEDVTWQALDVDKNEDDNGDVDENELLPSSFSAPSPAARWRFKARSSLSIKKYSKYIGKFKIFPIIFFQTFLIGCLRHR